MGAPLLSSTQAQPGERGIPTAASASVSKASATEGNHTMATSSSTTATTATTATPLATYLSLIQQYLAVFHNDNALWLAERCVAEYPGRPQAVYLQALCYYKVGKVRNARACLAQGAWTAVGSGSCTSGTTTTATTTTSSSSHSSLPLTDSYSNTNKHNSNHIPNSHTVPSTTTEANANANTAADTATTHSAILYLTAQCCLELGEYRRGETALLQTARTAYRAHIQLNPSQSSQLHRGGGGESAMNDWIVQTTPCPIPNGAAGLALLGKICRKSNRRTRAIQYYQMSLQLDPFLFTSFTALAELGADELDASAVFGSTKPTVIVAQPTRTSSMDGATENGPADSFLASGDVGDHVFSIKTPLQEQSMGSAIPSTAPRNGRTLTFDTPGLTPIHSNNHATTTTNTSTQNQNRYHHPMNESSIIQAQSASSSSFLHNHRTSGAPTPSVPPNEQNPGVVRRARQVASRQYYPPSPDTPLTSVTRSMRYLRGLGADRSYGGGGRSLFRGASENQTAHTSTNVGPAPPAVVDQRDGSTTGLSTSVRAHTASTTATTTIKSSTSSSTTTSTTLTTHGISNAVGSHSSSSNGGGTDPDTLKPEPAKEKENHDENNVQFILDLMAIAGTAYHHVCHYRCRETIQTLRQLPRAQQRTSWVLHQQGRAHLEQGDFQAAQRSLELMHKQDPGRMQGLDLLSTVYWQLKKEIDLANLAQRTLDWDMLSPEAHCVAGNCFSLQKDHETALVFFHRSLQLDPEFTYTHTLSGYEYMSNEDFDKATACFRTALRCDERHYNAWYGLGAIYHRQEKYDLAEYHFERAVSIHPTSAVLRCNLGMAQNANGKSYVALDTLSHAFVLDPRNPQARYQRATIYSTLHRPQEALVELEIVRDAAPREASVHFAMGKVLKRLGRTDEAMKCFLTAMDLDPKDNQLIKSAMDKLDEPDGDPEAMANF